MAEDDTAWLDDHSERPIYCNDALCDGHTFSGERCADAGPCDDCENEADAEG